MKIKLRVFYSVLLLASALFFQSCSSDKDAVKGEFQTGVLVANEGPFSSAGGDVTYYNASSGVIEQTIFKTVNGSFAGKILQSITIDGDNGYLVINADNKIEIVNSNTFKNTATFTDEKLINPRYLQVINGKAYISVWGAYNSNYELTDSYVMVVDLTTMHVVTTIATDAGVENLLYDGKYLYAANFNFGSSSTVAVINPSDNTLVKQIQVHSGPSGMVLDANNKVWVVTTSGDSELACINPSTLTVEKEISIGGYAGGDLGLSADKKSLIYSIGSYVYQVGVSATEAPANPYLDATDVVTFYGMGVDPKTGEVYIGDALNYVSDGLVYVYNADGTFKKTFAAGISPGFFVFR